MKIIVGLGNPGKKYRRTPHNVGFEVVDELALKLSCVLRRSFRFKARIGRAVLNEEKLMLVKPEKYMNNSGLTVASILRYRKVTPAELILVLDDANLEQGRLRVRARGGSGGHRGLESVITCVDSEEFTRVRIGIGQAGEDQELVEHVLTPFSPDEWRTMEPAIKHGAEAVLCILESGIEEAMNKVNAGK